MEGRWSHPGTFLVTSHSISEAAPQRGFEKARRIGVLRCGGLFIGQWVLVSFHFSKSGFGVSGRLGSVVF